MLIKYSEKDLKTILAVQSLPEWKNFKELLERIWRDSVSDAIGKLPGQNDANFKERALIFQGRAWGLSELIDLITNTSAYLRQIKESQ